MDELIHHCLRQLAFDGDLGCNVSRLTDFIAGYDKDQLVDDSFCAFVWSIVVQHPSVRVGILPPGAISEVYIAPQTSAKRKAAARGEQIVEGVPSSLELVDDARHRSLEDLKRQYGDHLRIAVSPETSFAAITGSHIRPPKLSPMVYTALQLITRGREDGITTVELGRKTKYDQKTCFYLIKQLVELGFIIKARRGGVGNHICIHKYFVERSPLWQQIQEEESRQDETTTFERIQSSSATDEAACKEHSQVHFEPIDSRHLSSLTLVKNRIIKLLKASRNHIHPSNNLLLTIGFVHPTKTDRRFFQTRLRELIQQGVIERVLVPSSKTLERTVRCLRLVTSSDQLPEGSVIVGQNTEEDEGEASLAEEASVGQNEVKTNLTIHKQVSDLLEEAGPSGLTLNEICAALGNFDKRTIELLLTRASNTRPPLHLADLGTVDLMETHGRERHHRYFTLAAYKCVVESERLQDATTSVVDADLSRVGDFATLDPKHFYTSAEKLHSYQDSLAAAKDKKRKRDAELSDGEETELLPKPKRGRPRKAPAPTDTPSAQPKKRGRSRKNAPAKDSEPHSAAPQSEPMTEGLGPTVADTPHAAGPVAPYQDTEQEPPETLSSEACLGEKHKLVTPPPFSRPPKRSRTRGGSRSRSNINISSMRRENELFKVIENMGGIGNMHSKELFAAHATLLETMSQANEPTSAPAGTRLDKRTAEATFKNLESRGRIKMLKTSLIASSGVRRPACVVYLSDTSQEKLNTFLRQLSQSAPSATPAPVKVLAEPVEYGLSLPSARHVSLPTNGFTVSEETTTGDPDRARQRIRRNRKAEEAQNSEAKSGLRKKAEAARAQRERDWDDLVHKVHPDAVKGTLAIRLRAVRGRFLQSSITKDEQHWENEIQEAIKETRLVFQKATSRRKPHLDVHRPAAGPPPVVPNPPEKSIETLISQQGPPIVQTPSMKKKGKAKEGGEVSRRPRFHWTREFDELARDATAIVRARSRASRLDLSALDQVFPAVPRNSVRQRITHLRDSAAEDLYMKRLEDQWYTVWTQYRGTPHLPDDDPSSPSNFNLIGHIEFLRKHVDKNALRVGFVEREAPQKLPVSVQQLYDSYDITEDLTSVPPWDFLWGTTVEEGREKQFRNQAFTKKPDFVYEYEGAKNERVQLAEAALKMVFGTPNELYDSESATRLLHSAGDQCVSAARSSLLHQGVLSKLVQDPKKPKPGRMLKISDGNLNALGGPFPRDLFQDAVSLEDVAVEQVVDEMEWPLLASEGDIATLFQLVSEDQVDFIIDLSQTRAARQKLDWNSKRADDEDIETNIRLKFSRMSVAPPGGHHEQVPENPAIGPDSDVSEQETHGTTLDGKEAACALQIEAGLVNCSPCINTAFTTFTSSLSDSDRDLARRILDNARGSRETGLDKATCLALNVGQERHALALAHRMTLTSPPILHWTYFNAPRLVAAEYCDAWAVVVADTPLTLVSPRRWLDIRGYRLDGAWKAAQQALVSVVFLHPGISQAELRWRLRAVYDRQEVIDLVSSLQEGNVLECRTDPSVDVVQGLPGWLKTIDQEEELVFWFISRNHHWYQF